MTSSRTVSFLRRAATVSAIVAMVSFLPAFVLRSGLVDQVAFAVYVDADGTPVIVRRERTDPNAQKFVSRVFKLDGERFEALVGLDDGYEDSCLWQGKLALVFRKRLMTVDIATGEHRDIPLPAQVLSTTLFGVAADGDTLWLAGAPAGTETVHVWSVRPIPADAPAAGGSDDGEVPDQTPPTDAAAVDKPSISSEGVITYQGRTFTPQPVLDLQPIVGVARLDTASLTATASGPMLNFFHTEYDREPVRDGKDAPKAMVTGISVWSAFLTDGQWTAPQRNVPASEDFLSYASGTDADGRPVVLWTVSDGSPLNELHYENDRWVQVRAVKTEQLKRTAIDIAFVGTPEGYRVGFATRMGEITLRRLTPDGWRGEATRVTEPTLTNRILFVSLYGVLVGWLAMVLFGVAFLMLRVRELKHYRRRVNAGKLEAPSDSADDGPDDDGRDDDPRGDG